MSCKIRIKKLVLDENVVTNNELNEKTTSPEDYNIFVGFRKYIGCLCTNCKDERVKPSKDHANNGLMIDFHHINGKNIQYNNNVKNHGKQNKHSNSTPSNKVKSISSFVSKGMFQHAIEEMSKCALICKNCHAYLHYTLPTGEWLNQLDLKENLMLRFADYIINVIKTGNLYDRYLQYLKNIVSNPKILSSNDPLILKLNNILP